MAKSPPISIVGLGRIGLPAASAFLKAGYMVYGYDTRNEAVNRFVEAGGSPAASAAECASHGGFVLVFVLDDKQLVEVIGGVNGILSSATRDLTLICLSTVTRRMLENLAAQCVNAGVAFVDCPFTGGPARIESRSLTLIAAAPGNLLEKVRPILETIGHIIHAGEVAGMAQAVKHCNQLMVAATHGAVMEVITLARKLGLDPSLVCSVIGSGIAGSDYFRLLSESVINHTPSPGSLGQMAKDAAIVRSTLQEANVNGLVAIAAAEYFAESMKQGMKDREGADLIHIVEQWPGPKDL